MAIAQSTNISVTITRPFEDVYAFLADLKNFPEWASGLGKLRRQVGAHEWIADSLAGPEVRIRLTPKNDFGIADHYVSPEEGDEIYIPLRAIRNGDGTDVLFTLFKLEGMSDKQFAGDQAHVKKDLEALKKLLES